MSFIRSKGDTVALAVATSGIAAIRLYEGLTAHSMFRIPLKCHADTNIDITPNKDKQRCELIRKCKLVIWDEAPNAHRHCIESVDRLFRNLRKNDDPFGDCTFVLMGDFRQIPPVVRGGSKYDIIEASIKNSELWAKVTTLKLTINERVRRLGNSKQDKDFADWLLRVGTGLCEEHCVDDDLKIKISPLLCSSATTLEEFINEIFENINEKHSDPNFFAERSILTPKNVDVRSINDFITAKFPGDTRLYKSVDTPIEDEKTKKSKLRYSTEFLNQYEEGGFPPHELNLKLGMPIMILRNLCPSAGICNGTRLIIREMKSRVIEAEIIAGPDPTIGTRFLIPRITLQPNPDYPFKLNFNRKQFPICPAFGMTINKSQGQTLKKVGLFIPDEVFCHGQLYVALSRVGKWQNLKIFSGNQEPYYLRNVVYDELFWDDPFIASSKQMSQTLSTDNIFESQHGQIEPQHFLPWKKIKKFTKLSTKFPELDKFFDCQVTYLWPSKMEMQLSFNQIDRFFFRFLQKKHDTNLHYLKDFIMIKCQKSMDTTN